MEKCEFEYHDESLLKAFFGTLELPGFLYRQQNLQHFRTNTKIPMGTLIEEINTYLLIKLSLKIETTWYEYHFLKSSYYKVFAAKITTIDFSIE